MLPMNRLSIIRHLQDPAVVVYLQVADTHCWRTGVPRPDLTFHPTTRYTLQMYLARTHVCRCTRGHTCMYTCSPAVTDKWTYLKTSSGEEGVAGLGGT